LIKEWPKKVLAWVWHYFLCLFVPDASSSRAAQAAYARWRSSPNVADGREMANEVFNVDVDMLFQLLFTNSKFILEFREAQKTYGE
jgi:hypothetical protein